VRSKTAHVSPPVEGLSAKALTTVKDAKVAGVLTNFYVDEDRIYARAGYVKVATMTGNSSVAHLIAYYGSPERLAAATNNTLCDAETGTVWKDGFTSNDWHWTAFSNLGESDYTVMVNGADGVWSWDGGVLAGSFVKETVTAPTGNTWLDTDNFHIVVAHMNRLFFADQANLCLWYLPLQQKSGEVAPIPLNSIFRRGGTIKAIATWTVDGGMGLDDQLVIFTTNGECAIYSGIDPDTDLGLVGVYRFDAPMSKHSVINYGGELYVLIQSGVTPMTAMIKAGKESLDTVDQSVLPFFLPRSIAFRQNPGWELFLNPSSGRLFANIPLGGGRYEQMIRNMPSGFWSKFEDVPARCWAWASAYVYFGDDRGNVYRMHPQYRTDDGAPIRVDVQMAWSQFKVPNIKHFKMLLTYIVSDGDPRPFVDVKTDYDQSPALNQPEISEVSASGATWDTATWDVDAWVGGEKTWVNWTGVGGLGRVGAIRVSAQVSNCSFAITGWNVLFEEGGLFG
jgi:hypothetical protein